ncbi:hypothetical protein [Nocardia sp. NPDC024068]|uniref:hypothetical protein n=1 Tax=Nocardia sp. NPDC024068 TaxID=3157197 RepID=UPI0033C01D28
MTTARPVPGWPVAAPATARIPGPTELTGVWRRTSIEWTDGTRDTATAVTWLQAGSHYADLRRPARRPDFAAVSCLRELTRPHLEWLSRQEGFAGTLAADTGNPTVFTWARQVDIEPFQAVPDTGTLHMEAGTLVERGCLQPYLERWQRDPPDDPAPVAALTLIEPDTGRRGYLLRAGADYAYVRDRLPVHTREPGLPRAVAVAGLVEAQDLVDIEISIGRVQAGWPIIHSSLPFRENHRLDPRLDPGAALLHTGDMSASGRATGRVWTVTDTRGDLRNFPLFGNERPHA